jgi:serine/threonine protein kinase
MEKYSTHRRNNLKQLFRGASEHCLDLLSRMIRWNPDRRIKLEDALAHPYFVETPKAIFPDEIKVLNKLEFYSKKSS